jgi:NAD(P)-dependent dehydrogenase (short-subunit alcohol dehydrogenase family)
VADITKLKKHQIEKLLQEAEKEYGPIDMVICCAGISSPAMFLSSEISAFQQHMEVNFFGVLNFVHPIAKRMVIRRDGGRIALIGDPTVVEKAIPGMGAYACSKGALD